MKQDIGLYEAIAENAEMGVRTLEQIIPMAENAEFREELTRERGAYGQMHQDACDAMSDEGGRVRGQSALAKFNARMGIAMKTAMGKSTQELAGMLIEGSTQGVMDCVRSRHEFTGASEKALAMATKLERFQMESIEALKRFL